MNDPDDDIGAIASLDDPLRRRVYEFVVSQAQPVTRDQASAELAIGRSLAAFHLDRLAREGLLATEFRRLSGRSGPGAGRPNKLYLRADRAFAVQVPERRYELAAAILVDAVEAMDAAGDRATGDRAAEAVHKAARRRGAEIAAQALGSDMPAEGDDPPDRIMSALEPLGFEPYLDPSGEIRLRNCPFRALVPDHRDTTCGMNLALVGGLLDGLAVAGVSARLDPQDGGCCVAMTMTGDVADS